MSIKTTIIDNQPQPFIILKYTTNTLNDCYACMDTNTTNMSDAQSTAICCAGLRCFLFWPLYLVGDILSCPFRGCIHLKNRNK